MKSSGNGVVSVEMERGTVRVHFKLESLEIAHRLALGGVCGKDEGRRETNDNS